MIIKIYDTFKMDGNNDSPLLRERLYVRHELLHCVTMILLIMMIEKQPKAEKRAGKPRTRSKTN